MPTRPLSEAAVTDQPPAGFTWLANELFVDTIEKTAGVAAFREAVIDRLEAQRTAAGETLTTDEIVRLYEQDLPKLLGREDLPRVDDAAYRRFLADLHEFTREAGLNAHRKFGSRFFVSFVCPDEIGVLSKLSGHLVEQGCNVEAATMAVIAGQVATMLIVSGPNRLRDVQLSRTLADLPTEVFGPSSELPSPPQVEPVRPREAQWPRAGSSDWNMYAEVPDRVGTLATVTGVIAEHHVPLTAFATWVTDDGMCVLDLNYAVQSGVDEELLAGRLRSVLMELEGRPIRINRTTRPFHGVADRFALARAGSALVVTVLGRAEPGLVAAITRAVSGGESAEVGSPPSAFNILGSAMAILEGNTALTLVLEDTTPSAPEESLRAIRRAIESETAASGFEARVANAYLLGGEPQEAPPPTTPTHHLYCDAPEEPGVLATVASLIADSGANIVWLMSRVVDTADNGTAAVTCELRLDLAAPSEAHEALGNGIAALRSMRGWRIELVPWGQPKER
jgi:glycine cleavage system regulatory protein